MAMPGLIALVQCPKTLIDGCLKPLRKLVPALDPMIEQYGTEVLKAYEQGTVFAPAVMIGAASEKGIYVLCESQATGIQRPETSSHLGKFTNGRVMNSLFGFIPEHNHSRPAAS
jgi:hypothetical protein